MLQVRLHLPSRGPVAVAPLRTAETALMSMRQLYSCLEHVVGTWQQFHNKAKEGKACQSTLPQCLTWHVNFLTCTACLELSKMFPADVQRQGGGMPPLQSCSS